VEVAQIVEVLGIGLGQEVVAEELDHGQSGLHTVLLHDQTHLIGEQSLLDTGEDVLGGEAVASVQRAHGLTFEGADLFIGEGHGLLLLHILGGILACAVAGDGGMAHTAAQRTVGGAGEVAAGGVTCGVETGNVGLAAGVDLQTAGPDVAGEGHVLLKAVVEDVHAGPVHHGQPGTFGSFIILLQGILKVGAVIVVRLVEQGSVALVDLQRPVDIGGQVGGIVQKFLALAVGEAVLGETQLGHGAVDGDGVHVLAHPHAGAEFHAGQLGAGAVAHGYTVTGIALDAEVGRLEGQTAAGHDYGLALKDIHIAVLGVEAHGTHHPAIPLDQLGHHDAVDDLDTDGQRLLAGIQQLLALTELDDGGGFAVLGALVAVAEGLLPRLGESDLVGQDRIAVGVVVTGEALGARLSQIEGHAPFYHDYNRAAITYRSLHNALENWLGITPLKETSELYYAIMDEWNRAAEDRSVDDGDLLIGRWDQFQQMARPFQAGHGRPRPRSMVLMGEAGVGKSHLLNYFLRRADLGDWTVITTSCFKSRQEEPLHPWQAIMTSLHALITQDGIPIPVPLALAAAELFPVFSPADAPVSSGLSPDSSTVYEGTLAILSAVSARRPLLLVFEDIQWMDAASVLLLDKLIHRVTSDRILFAAACRTPTPAGIGAFLDAVQEDHLLTRFELSPFTPEETDQFIGQAGAEDFSPELKERIYRDTRGNAFLLVQLLASLLERGKPDVMPNSAEEIMAYRLSGLSREGQKILDIIAMFPDCAPFEVLEHMSSKSPMDLLYICQELRGRSIINEVTDGGSLSFMFAQPEFQELAYSRIQPLSRRILHLNIAGELARSADAHRLGTVTQIVYHYRQGGDERNALRYRIRQFKLQTLTMAVLSFPSDPAEEISAGPKLQVLELLERMQKDLERLREIYPQTESLEEMERELLYSKGCYCVFKGQYQSGVAALEQLLQLDIDHDLRDLVYEQMIFYGIQIYDTTIMRRYITKALELTRDRNPGRYAINRRYYGFLLMMEENFSQAEIELRNSLTLLRDSFPDCPEYAIQAGYARNYLGETFRKQGRYEEAVQEYEAAIAATVQYGPATSLSVFYNNYAVTSFACGRYDTARRLFDRAQEYLAYIEEPSGYRTVSFSYRALYAFAAGNDAQACSLLRQAGELADSLSGPYDQGIVLMIKALLSHWCSLSPGTHPAVEAMLPLPCARYAEESRRKLEGKSALFERQLLQKLEQGEPVLQDFLSQVTEK